MAKKSRQGTQPNPAIRLSNLGFRAAKLFTEASGDPQSIADELDRLTDGLKPGSFLPLVLGAFAEVPEAQREALGTAIDVWLRRRGLFEALHALESQHTFREPTRSVVRTLLAAGGISLAAEALVHPADRFLAAFEFGGVSQDSPTLFWYEDDRRRRVCSAAFLIDFEPPWEGALKDVAFTRHRDFNEALDEFHTHWQRAGLEPHPIDAATAAQRVWKALRQNQAQGIRLPTDFIAVLPLVLPFLEALPADPDTAPLSAAELEVLATTGRSPESIRRDEARFGYQTRLQDGSVVHIIQ